MKYLTTNQFGGINRAEQIFVPVNAENPPYSVVDNFIGGHSDASLGYIGMIKKSPHITPIIPDVFPAVGRSRGLFQYVPNITTIASLNFIIGYQQTTDYTVTKLYACNTTLGTNVWTTLVTGAGYLPASADVYDGKIYMLLNSAMYKWNGDVTNWPTAPYMREKGGAGAAITVATLTWNGTATVTSDVDISAKVSYGDWIRRSSTSTFYDEVLSVAAGGLTITLTSASLDSGASAAGGAQKAGIFTVAFGGLKPYFIKFWKNKCWVCGNNDNLYCSVTGDPENFTGTGSAAWDLSSQNQEGVSGIDFLDDYLLIFFDLHYEVWKWTGDIDEPIELVRTWPYGCASHRTIQKANGVLIYLSPGDVRITTGTEDQSIAGDIKTYAAAFLGVNRSYYYFLTGAGANEYPWATIDMANQLYKLHLPSGSGNTTVLNYDFRINQWVGRDSYYDAGHGLMFYLGPNANPYYTFSSMQKGAGSVDILGFKVPPEASCDAAGIIESATFYSGLPNKKLKVYWVQYDFFPQTSGLSIDTNILFNYKKDLGATSAAKQLTYNMTYAAPATPELITKRFNVNDACQYFSWYLTETFNGAVGSLTDFMILSWTMAYDVMDDA